jgi:acyl-coenzyme A synthetase/AMP-(fatty) acid ligase
MNGARLKKELENGVTMMQATPAGWQVLLHAGWQGTAGLKALCGGETLSADLAGKLVSRSETVWNMYGPTETTVWSLTAKLGHLGNRVSIGRPIANTRVYILDGRQQPVPVGVSGELYIGGVGVGRGYLKREELTRERFVKDPFVEEEGARMYRTGDLGRWQADGTIEFLGRNDFQVKVRGFRIELEEIEARLVEYPGIKEAVVVVREEGGGEKQLVAYYTVVGRENGGEGEVGAEQLRGYVGEKLPEYMVPAAYVRLETMPLTGNGKLDRKGLPAPGVEAYGVSGYEEPQGEMERQLAEIWAEVLQVERVGRHDNFFALGGHSLLVFHVISRLSDMLYLDVLQLKISPLLLFRHPTLEGLAQAIEGLPDDAVTNEAFSIRQF